MLESGVYRRQILTSKDGLRARRLKVIFLIPNINLCALSLLVALPGY